MLSSSETLTLTRSEAAGKVTLIRMSSEDGGTRRSPFLEAPFNSIWRALGAERILSIPTKKKQGKN